MDYTANVSAVFDFSYIDLLERIASKFGTEEFLCKKLKLIRSSKWTVDAKAAGVKLMETIYKAVETMAKEVDPCMEILDRSQRAFANNAIRFIKLPLVRSKDTVRKVNKEVLVDEVTKLRRMVAELKAENEELAKEAKRERHLKEDLMVKVGATKIPDDCYTNLPAVYKGTDYSSYLKPVNVKTGNRPYFGAKDYSFLVESKLPFIADWIVAEQKSLEEKQPAHSRERVNEGLMAKKASERRSGARTAVSQFFKFVAITHDLDHKTFVPKQEHLLSNLTLSAFLEFYSQHAGSPNSAGNKAKFLVNLYKHMWILDQFQQYGKRFKVIFKLLNKFIGRMKDQNALHHSQHCLNINLLLKGQWLEPAELSSLNRYVSIQIVLFLRVSKRRKPKLTLVYNFQKFLILFALLQTGGQRREVFANFAIDNFAIIEGQLVHFTLDEKVQKRKTDRLALPETLGNLIRIWIDEFRPMLVPKDSNVLSCFVNKQGKPLLPRNITEWVKKKIQCVFPGRIITPICIRRIMVTEMAVAMAENPNEFFIWASKHATLINTSDKVLMQNYNRANQNKASAETLKTVNTTLALEPSEAIREAVSKHAEDATYLKKDSAIVEEITDMRYHNDIRQYLCKLKDGSEVWTNYMSLSGAVPIVITYLKKKALAQRKNNPHLKLPALNDAELDEHECSGRGCSACEEDESDCNSDCDSDSESSESDEDIPELETASEDESDAMSMEETVAEPLSATSVAVESLSMTSTVVEPLSAMLTDGEPLSTTSSQPVVASAPRKRKRGSEVAEPQKKTKVTYQDNEILIDNRPVKPGDVVSINPEGSKDLGLGKTRSLASCVDVARSDSGEPQLKRLLQWC